MSQIHAKDSRLMLGALLVLAIAACDEKTIEEQIKSHGPRIQAMQETLEIALARTDEQKAADMVDIDAISRGDLVPAIPDELRRQRPLQLGLSRAGIASPLERCHELLEKTNFRGDASSMGSYSEIREMLKACEARYIEVIGKEESAGAERYAYGTLGDGPTAGTLSKAGTFEIFDVTDKKRIVSVRFQVREAAPSAIDMSELHQLDHDRLYRAADAAFKRLLETKPKPR